MRRVLAVVINVAPVAGVDCRVSWSDAFVFGDHELMTLARLKGEPAAFVANDLAGDRELEEAMPQPVVDFREYAVEGPIDGVCRGSVANPMHADLTGGLEGRHMRRHGPRRKAPA